MNYSTSPVSVVMSAVSVSPDNNQVFQVPLYDPLKTPSSAGGYPWKADGDFTTVVYLKNETNQPKKFTMDLVYEGGGYTLGIREIKAHETMAIDFRALRDAQTPDATGKIIPFNIEKGQIGWSINGRENKTLNGRSEQISLSQGISSTYDCRNCCPNSYLDSYIDPLQAMGEVGDVTDFDAFFREANCYGQPRPYNPADFVNWESTDPNVASCDYNGLTTGMSPGYATIQARWTAGSWFDNGNEICEPISLDILQEAYCDIVGTTVTINVPETAFDGDMVQFSVSVQGGTATAYQWSFQPTRGGNNPQVNFSDPAGAMRRQRLIGLRSLIFRVQVLTVDIPLK